MRVSVIIPTYNSGPLAVEAVASVLAQTRPADEVLVIDDGSTDDTAERVSAFGPPVRYICKENGGVATARNRGVAEATGEVIAFLDADDVWHPRKLELQLLALAARPELGLLGCWTYPWPADRPREQPGKVPGVVDVPRDDLTIRNCLVTSTVVARASALRRAGEFDTILHGPEDYDLWLRVARHTAVANLDAALTGYRTGTPGSLSKNAVRMEAGMRRILDKLDAAGAFSGRGLFRRKVRAHYHYLWGSMHREAGNRLTAAKHVTSSLLIYPLPYSRHYVRYPLGRLRLLLNSLIR
jgi:glycosyltransferase involved in cell wall biosynthesis